MKRTQSQTTTWTKVVNATIRRYMEESWRNVLLARATWAILHFCDEFGSDTPKVFDTPTRVFDALWILTKSGRHGYCTTDRIGRRRAVRIGKHLLVSRRKMRWYRDFKRNFKVNEGQRTWLTV